MILKMAMSGRKEEFKLSRMRLFSPQTKLQLKYRSDAIKLPNNKTDTILTEQNPHKLRSSLPHLDFMMDTIRKSLTPKKTLEFQSPKIPLVSQYFTGNQIFQKITAGYQSNCVNIANSELLPSFVREEEDVAPLLFLRGEIQIQQISDPYNIRQSPTKLIQILVPKLVNFSQTEFYPNTLCLYIIGTQQPVEKSHINLQPNQYNLILKAPIARRIGPQSTQKCLYLESKYKEKSWNTYKVNLVLLVRDEKNRQVLYWRNYLNPEQLIKQLRRKAHGHKKLEQIV